MYLIKNGIVLTVLQYGRGLGTNNIFMTKLIKCKNKYHLPHGGKLQKSLEIHGEFNLRNTTEEEMRWRVLN